jgi:HEAT repeat protein
MIRTLLILAVLALPLRAADCANCTPAKLCTLHADCDKDAAKKFQEGMGNADPAVRKAALDLFADACFAHANSRPASNALLMGSALKDPDVAVRIRAAGHLGTSQDKLTAIKLFDPLIEPLCKKLAKEPKPGKEEVAWDNDFNFIKAIVHALGEIGIPEAGPAMIKILECARFTVIEEAAKECHKIRSKEMPPALLKRLEEVKKSPPDPFRDRTFTSITVAFEKLTSSGVAQPANSSPGDGTRWLNECKAWWKANEKTWK